MKKYQKSTRLENSLRISQDFVQESQTRNSMMAEYYKKKIELKEQRYKSRTDYENKKLIVLQDIANTLRNGPIEYLE